MDVHKCDTPRYSAPRVLQWCIGFKYQISLNYALPFRFSYIKTSQEKLFNLVVNLYPDMIQLLHYQKNFQECPFDEQVPGLLFL